MIRPTMLAVALITTFVLAQPAHVAAQAQQHDTTHHDTTAKKKSSTKKKSTTTAPKTAAPKDTAHAK